MQQDPPVVSARAVLAARLELDRLGHSRALANLESVEPDLAEYLMESLSLLYQQLGELGAPARATRRVFRQAEALALVSIAALRHGHYQLWQDMPVGQALARHDPTLAAPPQDPAPSLPPHPEPPPPP